MKCKLLSFLAISMSLFSVSVNASFRGPAEVDVINTNANGWPVTAIVLKGGIIFDKDPNCAKTVVLIHHDDSGHDSSFSILLAAKMSGKKVSISTNGCDSYGYPKFKELSIIE